MQLENPPIKEIIFTISFNEDVNMECLENFKNLADISADFPEVDKGFQVDIQVEEGQQTEAKIESDGFILRAGKNANRLLQARRGSLALHKIREYEKFDTLINDFKKYWSALQQCVGQLSVNKISLRYINFIVKQIGESNEKLVNVYPQYPFEEYPSSFVHLKFPYSGNESIAVSVITANSKDEKKDGIILDIILNQKLDNEVDTESIFKLMSEMRTIKNELFFKCITTKTIERYTNGNQSGVY